MNEDFTENLFKSIDTIVSARLANLPYDQTIECEVINVDEDFDGKYLVKYQAATFIARGTPKAYKVNDIVYVQVPQKDFTQEKFIINKKSNSETRKVKKLPFLSFAKNGNLSPAILSSKEFIIKTTGDNKRTEEMIYSFNSFYNEPYAAGYTRFGLKAAFKFNAPKETISGDYGIDILITGFDQNSTYLPARDMRFQLETKKFTLATKDMISSNYYDTPGYCNQEIVCDITDFLIYTIQIVAWQDGNFITENYLPITGSKIYISNVSTFLGYDISEFRNNSIKAFLYTTSGYKFNDEYYTKTIQTRFLELGKNNNLNVITDQLDTNNYNIFWEEYDPNIKTKGPQSGIVSFRNLSSNNLGNIYQNIDFIDGQSRLRYSYVVVITDSLNHKFISNRLDFVKDTYLQETELLDLLTSFFRIDDNGKVFLNGGTNSQADGLNITNLILNDNYIAKNATLRLMGDFTIKVGDTTILEFNDKNIVSYLPIIDKSSDKGE